MPSFDNKEQCGSCGEYHHERSMTFDKNGAWCAWCYDEIVNGGPEADHEAEGAQAFMAHLTDSGYEIIHTGGGCTAFAKRFGSCDVMITQDASHEIIPEYMSDLGLVIGVYPDDLEGQHLFFLNPTHTSWEIICDSVAKAETAAQALDGIAAFQKIEA